MITTAEANATYRGRAGLVTSDLIASWTVRRRDRDIFVVMTVPVLYVTKCHITAYGCMVAD